MHAADAVWKVHDKIFAKTLPEKAGRVIFLLKNGALLDGKYKILDEIGRGGMSVVYLAINEKANKTWAVKEVRKTGGHGPAVMEQSLAAELELLKKLRHPNLPAIIDVIEAQESIIIVMDYIEGKSLQAVLNEDGPQDAERVIAWAAELCDVLGYLHAQRPPIIYRDMKPANVILRPDGHVTLIDFGTAREYKNQTCEDTMWLGTRGYAAPEQLGGKGQTDARTDIYSLGTTLYHLLTGHSPADTHFVIYPTGKFRPELAGSGLEKVVAKCCRPVPDQRFQNCHQLMYALEHVHDEDDAVRNMRKRRWRFFLACILLALAGAIGNAGFSLLKADSVAHSYHTCLERAANASDFTEASVYCQKAIALRPGEEAAYEEMLDKMTEDGTIAQAEKIRMDDVLNVIQKSRRGVQTNLECLKEKNPEGYADFIYRLGCDYYVFYPNGQREANQYLRRAVEDDSLAEEKRAIARSLVIVTDYYVHAAYAGADALWAEPLDADTYTYTYEDFWNTLMTMLSDPDTADEKTGGRLFSIALYREAATQITTNLPEIMDAGISRQALDALLKGADVCLSKASGRTGGVAEEALFAETVRAAEAAKDEMTSYFRQIGE